MRIAVVTGGRHREPAPREYQRLHDELVRRDIDVVRVGCATGVDAEVYDWVRDVYLRERWHAAWDEQGPKAGPWRNRAMLTGKGVAGWRVDSDPRFPTHGIAALVVLALPGGRGTADCCKAARADRIAVVELGEAA